MKFIKWAMACISIAISTFAVANVSMEMFKMNREMGQLLNAESTEQFQQSANNFIQAATQAQATMPRSLDNDQHRFEGYQKGMQEIIDVVNQAKNLAEQGQLAEAKATVSQLNTLKKHYHSEYK